MGIESGGLDTLSNKLGEGFPQIRVAFVIRAYFLMIITDIKKNRGAK